MNDKAAQVTALKAYFSNIQLPSEMRISPGERVTDIPKFLKSHFTILEQEDAKGINDAFLQRLLKLKAAIEQNTSQQANES